MSCCGQGQHLLPPPPTTTHQNLLWGCGQAGSSSLEWEGWRWLGWDHMLLPFGGGWVGVCVWRGRCLGAKSLQSAVGDRKEGKGVGGVCSRVQLGSVVHTALTVLHLGPSPDHL